MKEINNSDENNSEKLQAEIAYKYIMQLRNLGATNLWSRSNVMLVLQGGLLAFIAGNFSSLIVDNRIILIALSFFGLLISFFWYRLTKGGSFWIEYWQNKLREIENQVVGEIKIFRNHPSMLKNKNQQSKLKNMGYTSTRRILKQVSFITIILWIILLCYAVFYQPRTPL